MTSAPADALRTVPLPSEVAWARRIGWAVALVGVLIVLGWLADVRVLRTLIPLQDEARPNAGACFVLLGVALVLRGAGPTGRHPGTLACAGATLVLAGLTLAQYLTGRDWGVDGLLVPAGLSAETTRTVRMSLPATVSFLLLGGAVVALHRPGGERWATGLGLLALTVAALAFFGYLFNVPWLASFGPFAPMPALTGIALLVLAGGVLLASGAPTDGQVQRTGLAIGFAAALLLLIALGVAVLHNARLLVENNRRVVHTYEVMAELQSTIVAIQDLETGTRGYLLTGNTDFLDPAREAPVRARASVRHLQQLVADNPVQVERSAALARAVEDKVRGNSRQIELVGDGDRDAARQLVAAGEGRRLMEEIRDLVAAMEVEEDRLLRVRLARAEASTGRTLFALATGLGTSIGLLIVVFIHLRREVAARTQLARDLRRSEESLAVTLHSIGDAVLATDTAGRVTLMNGVAEQLTGWSIAEARGRAVAEVFRIIHEQTREPARIPVEDVLATGQTRALANHTALIARDGVERSIADSAAPIRGADGRILGAVLVFRDVTDSRRAQEQLDRFFELSLDFLCISSADGYFKRASPAVTDVLGWTVEEFLAMPYMEQVHPDDRAATQREVERQLQRGEKVLYFENRYRHKNGTWRTLAWRSVAQSGLMYATARDVTEARMTEERIRSLNRRLQLHTVQLEAANQELESFSYSVSHDLRAPLRHIQGYVEMLTREAQGTLTEKGQRFLRTIADAAREMGVLIDDLLSFSRMGRTELRETEVDTARLVAEVRSGLERDVAGREIRWKIGELPPVRGDAAMLRLVFVNLLGNAVKYTRRCPVAEIEVGCAGREEDRVVLFVRDNGAGFDMNTRTSSLASSSDCTGPTNSRARASGSRRCAASSGDTAAAPGPKAASTPAPLST